MILLAFNICYGLLTVLVPTVALFVLVQCCSKKKRQTEHDEASFCSKSDCGHEDDGQQQQIANKDGKQPRGDLTSIATGPAVAPKPLKPKSPPLDPNLIHLVDGTYVGEYQVLKRLGEGGCGVVYRVVSKKGDEYAMKIERLDLRKKDQLLPLESQVLKRLQCSPHAAKYVQFGRSTNFRVLVMGILGQSLSNLQDGQPAFNFKIGTVLRVGIQSLRAIAFLHTIYFVHRDIKPGNFAIGQFNPRRIYLLDFGLARSLKKRGSARLRSHRENVPFRGTPGYCSLNAHYRKEHGRHDDLWSLMYMLIDLNTGGLPWFGRERDEMCVLKEQLVDEQEVMPTCPMAFAVILEYLRSLDYYQRPDYVGMEQAFIYMMKYRGVHGGQKMEWENNLAPIAKKRSNLDARAQLETGPTGSSNTRDLSEESDFDNELI